MSKIFACFLVLGSLLSVLRAQQSCETLVHLKLLQATVTAATLLPEGPFVDPARPNSPPLMLPKHCVVKATARPTSDSEINWKVRMPAEGWNGKYRQTGNGGWAGAIPTAALAQVLRLGFAIAGTDDGHEGGGGAEWP